MPDEAPVTMASGRGMMFGGHGELLGIQWIQANIGLQGREDDLAAVLFLLVEDLVALPHLPASCGGVMMTSGFMRPLAMCSSSSGMKRCAWVWPHLEDQALVEGIAEQEAVDEAGIHARHADHAAAPRGRDAWRSALPLEPSSFRW
jgi:hypothetical protein